MGSLLPKEERERVDKGDEENHRDDEREHGGSRVEAEEREEEDSQACDDEEDSPHPMALLPYSLGREGPGGSDPHEPVGGNPGKKVPYKDEEEGDRSPYKPPGRPSDLGDPEAHEAEDKQEDKERVSDRDEERVAVSKGLSLGIDGRKKGQQHMEEEAHGQNQKGEEGLGGPTVGGPVGAEMGGDLLR